MITAKVEARLGAAMVRLAAREGHVPRLPKAYPLPMASEVSQRRAEVLEMRRAGVKNMDIAARLGWPLGVIAKDIRTLRKQGAL